MRLILASQSPRRKELLSSLGYEYEVCPADIDETVPKDVESIYVPEILSRNKALFVLRQNPDAVVIGSDTVVICDGQILGKPQSEEEARLMLSLLSGKKHKVATGLCVCSKEKTRSLVSVTDVYFHELTQNLIDAYIATGEPMDKAGAYGIQGVGSVLVRKIDGDYFTVMGLPLSQTARLLSEFGIFGNILKF
ncbi:MAG: Maf family protein [Acutalibacteraceae bacterium]